MRLPIGLILIAAAVALAAVLVAGQALLQPGLPLISDAGFTLDTITPNADGSDDVTVFEYSLSRPARVSLALQAEDGAVYDFRRDEPRIADDYRVEFSGVVDGFTLPGEEIEGEVVRRLLPDGVYTWRLTAQTETGETDEQTGTLTIVDGDPALPELTGFTIYPDDFTPNQDGVSDRVQINVVLTKDADLTVYLLDAEGAQYVIPERLEDVLAGEAGRHTYDYEGGVDRNADPPPDGTYTVVAEAQDAVGQRIRQTGELTIRNGGKPLANITAQPSGADVVFEARPYEGQQPGDTVEPPSDADSVALTGITMPVGDLLVFKLTIENYSRVPIRTTGPEPGTVYEQDQVAASLGWLEEPGAWRVGIDCETATRDYPWRWAIAPRDNLIAETNPATGDTYYYLPPGERSVVWGAIRMTEINPLVNPQTCWAGLIHEKVEVAAANSNVGPRQIELVVTPDP